MRRLGRGLLAALALLLGLTLLAGCSAPPLPERAPSQALPADAARATVLGKAIVPLADQHPGLSGIYPLAEPLAAFAARALLVQAAEKTLDVQYYIWRGDMTGTLLLEALHDAAERGVRVRLLLDDNGITGLDDVLAALDGHPNIEVRLFNPFTLRQPKMLGFLTDFSRLNRRMHNKSFTADNQATIIGGRNIGDEYFGAADDVLFADLDLLAVGQVVGEVSQDFDRYWASVAAYPAEALLGSANATPLQALHESAENVEKNPAAARYMQALRELPFIGQMLEGKLDFEWAPTRLVSDDPAKILNPEADSVTLVDELKLAIGEPAVELELVSPYFVPTAAGTDALTQMVQRGVRVQVLTNAYEATDVAVVHSGYARQREALLRGGVTLYEMRGEPDARPQGLGSFGSSGSSLHAKTFSVDRQRVFVGSFNFDPRSINLNTELGFVVDSPTLANQMADLFERDIARQAYRVGLDADGSMYWVGYQDGVQQRYDTEPGTSWWERGLIWLLSLLPIEPLL